MVKVSIYLNRRVFVMKSKNEATKERSRSQSAGRVIKEGHKGCWPFQSIKRRKDVRSINVLTKQHIYNDSHLTNKELQQTKYI